MMKYEKGIHLHVIINECIKFQENPYDMFRQNHVSGQTDILIPIHYPKLCFTGKIKFIKKRGGMLLNTTTKQHLSNA